MPAEAGAQRRVSAASQALAKVAMSASPMQSGGLIFSTLVIGAAQPDDDTGLEQQPLQALGLGAAGARVVRSRTPLDAAQQAAAAHVADQRVLVLQRRERTSERRADDRGVALQAFVVERAGYRARPRS